MVFVGGLVAAFGVFVAVAAVHAERLWLLGAVLAVGNALSPAARSRS